MARFFCLEASKNVKDYISLKDGTQGMKKAAQMSEFQFFDNKPLTIEIDNDSGRIFQDFINDNDVPIVSNRLKDFLVSMNVDYLLYKKIILTQSQLGIEEDYWLALPPRINCLNREKSIIDEILNVADEIVINENKIGRFEIFKLAGVGNLQIIATEHMAQALENRNFVGIHILPINY